MRGSQFARVRSYGGLTAAAVALAATGTVAGGAAGQGADNKTIYVTANGYCFTVVPNRPMCEPSDSGDIPIDTGDTVTWDFAGAAAPHNAASKNEVDGDPSWKDFAGRIVSPSDEDTSYEPRMFTHEGEYVYECQIHPGMEGKITVTGPPVTPTATATATVTATATATPSTQPSPPGADQTTPAPSGGSDAVKPRLTAVNVKPLRRAARLQFRLSEPATVTVRVKRRGARRVLRSVRVRVTVG